MQLETVMRVDMWSAALAAGLVVFSLVAYRRTAPPLAPGRRALLRALRAGSFLLLALLVVNPAIVSSRAEQRSPLVIVLLDRSRSMSVRDEGGLSRMDAANQDAAVARRALEQRGAEVEVLPFAESLAPSPLPPDSSASPDGDGTDIAGALEAAGRRHPAGVAAIVLLSDGRATRGMASKSGISSAPVYVVGYGDTVRGVDVSIVEIVADRIAYRGTTLRVEAIVRTVGSRGDAIEVRLLEDGKERARASLSARLDAEDLSAVFDYVPEREGAHRLTIEALPAGPGDDPGNNVESIRIDVRGERIRLLSIDESADWNVAFLRDLAKRSKRLDADIVLRIEGSGRVLEPGGETWTFPPSASGLAPYDLVIVGDDGGLFGTRERVETLERYVEQGGSVLFLGGEGSPMVRESSCSLLERLLPVRRTGAVRIEYSDWFVKASDGVFDPAPASLVPVGSIDALPPFPGRIVGLAPGAGARTPLELDGEGRGAFLSIDRRGEGLSAAVLGFPLWRWKLAGREGARAYESLLGGIVQYLAEGAKSPPIALDADRAVYRSGDRVRLTASVGEGKTADVLRGELRRREGAASAVEATFLFEPDPRRRGVYRAALGGLTPGEYIAVAAESPPGALGTSRPAEFAVEPLSVEFLDVSKDRFSLARMAEETKGACIGRSGLASAVAGWNLPRKSVEIRSARDLRGSVFGFLGLVAMLGAEWAVRKAWGLV